MQFLPSSDSVNSTVWMHHMDGNKAYREKARIRMLQAILNKSWKQDSTKQQLYSPLPPITKTIQIRQTRHAGHCWRSKSELLSDVLLHMVMPVLAGQRELTFNSSVWTREVIWKTCWE